MAAVMSPADRLLGQRPPGLTCNPNAPSTGRAAEEILYGQDEMSTINQRQLTLARRVAQKLVVSGGLSDAAGLGPSPITHPVPMGGTLGQIVPARVRDASGHILVQRRRQTSTAPASCARIGVL